MTIHLIGIDPGLVDTGVVRMIIRPNIRVVDTYHAVVSGIDPMRIKQWIEKDDHPKPHIFIEKYRPRQGYGTDERMVQGERDLKVALPGAVLIDNTGVRKIVGPKVMSTLGLWSFTTSSNHQDLRSAARILLYGALKDDALNEVLADIIRDELDGQPWEVYDHGGHAI